MRMSVQVPRSMMGAIPDAHRIVTDHDGLAMYGDFRKVAEPRELLGQLANLFVVIARHRKDLPAANLLAVLQSPHLAPDAEIPKEIEDVIGLNGGVETFEDRLIHFLDVSKRSITVADYVAMTEMKICRKPYVRHLSRCETACCAGPSGIGIFCCDWAALDASAVPCRTLANHVPSANPSARAALATTGSQIAQTCFSSLTRKSSICCALVIKHATCQSGA